jgi:hypothetical protein
MEKAKNVANTVIQGGVAGYSTGRMIGQGVGAAHNAAQRIPAYRRATEASAVGRYYSRQMPRDTGGPRTAGFYQYRYGLGGADGPSVGTDAQRALLQEQRAVQTHLDNLTRAPRAAAFHNENPMLPDMSEFRPAPRPKAKAKAKSRPESWHERQMREYRRQGVSQPMGQYHGAREIN